jgi:hypothetical protein
MARPRGEVAGMMRQTTVVEKPLPVDRFANKAGHRFFFGDR